MYGVVSFLLCRDLIINRYSDGSEEVHRVSQHVLQLAAINCFLTCTIRLIALIFALIRGYFSLVTIYLVDVALAVLVMHLGVRGVKTRNAPCCGHCCGCLTGFYIVYIVLSILEAINFFVAVAWGLALAAIVDLAFLILYCVTAEEARKLLDLLATMPRRPLAPPQQQAEAPRQQTQHPPTLAVAEATDVRIVEDEEEPKPPDENLATAESV